jgi:probable F420-dependent oxidoreductase
MGARVGLGVTVRLMGPQSTPRIIADCARAAEAAGLDDVWVADHIAIPPDDAEGSDGRYLDALTSLAYLAAVTRRIGLGTAVLVLPYRAALPTAKVVATVQELSGGRLRLGVGAGWLEPEFRALGVPRRERGRITDAALEFLVRCFASDEVESNGQRFLFRPRPARPPIYVGGAAPHALRRAVAYGDGWMPMPAEPAELAGHVRALRELAAAAGRPAPGVVALAGFSPRDPARAADQARALVEAGATHLIAGSARYADADEFRRSVEFLAQHIRPALG